ncbi:MAG: plasmid pRiA4b ORF-3 family protein [Phycisphaeraceae bacterium]|nr:plasmid pRiA4b ORF-3 family protein [Phycisphaeraceae bacterium]
MWRRIVVPSETKLPKFNRMLEAVMGWEGYHLHMFEIADLRIGVPDEDDDDVIDERRITVKQLLPRVGSQVRWAYDFGDNWQHDVVVEAIEEPSPDARYPMCTAGERACPPEDCGGVGGYEELREVLADPAHDEYEHLREWAGAGFDADAFDQMAVTKCLRQVR